MSKELDINQYDKFLKLIASQATYGDFQIHLGIGQRDVEFYKTKYGIANATDAQNILNGKVKNQKTSQEIMELQRKNQLNSKEKQGRLNEAMKKLQVPGTLKYSPNEKSQKNKVHDFNKLQETNKILDKDLPKINEEQFKLDSRLGLRLLTEKYSLEKSVVIALLKKLNVNVDLLPR